MRNGGIGPLLFLEFKDLNHSMEILQFSKSYLLGWNASILVLVTRLATIRAKNRNSLYKGFLHFSHTMLSSRKILPRYFTFSLLNILDGINLVRFPIKYCDTYHDEGDQGSNPQFSFLFFFLNTTKEAEPKRKPTSAGRQLIHVEKEFARTNPRQPDENYRFITV